MLPILTLNNLYEFDDTLFDGITLPDPAISKDLLVDCILDHFGEMAPVVPDWSMLRFSINNWFAAHSRQLARLWDAYMAEYDPVYNKDAYYEETRTPDLVNTRSSSRTSSHGTNVQESRSENRTSESAAGETTDSRSQRHDEAAQHPGEISTESGSTTEQYKGFNSSGFNDVSKELPAKVITASGSNTGESDSAVSGTSEMSRTGTERGTSAASSGRTETGGGSELADETETRAGTETLKRREYGNIGVTMASAMIRDSVGLWKAFNWYEVAAEIWASDNLVMIY